MGCGLATRCAKPRTPNQKCVLVSVNGQSGRTVFDDVAVFYRQCSVVIILSCALCFGSVRCLSEETANVLIVMSVWYRREMDVFFMSHCKVCVLQFFLFKSWTAQEHASR